MNIIIVGNGKVGYTLAEYLTVNHNHDVTIIDKDRDALRKATETLDVLCVRGNGGNVRSLIEAGAEKADVIIAVTANDELNMVCCLAAKQLGTRYSIARVRNPEYTESLSLLQERLDIDQVINPERAAAQEISRLRRFPLAMNIEAFSHGRVEMVEFLVRNEDSDIIGIPLAKLHSKFPHVQFVAARRKNEAIVPDGSFVIHEGDRVYVSGEHVAVTRFFKTLHKDIQRARSAFLIGGGHISYYLARQLVSLGMRIKLIEIKPDKCRKLSEDLEDVDVVCGDGSDRETLLDENMEAYDALICLTDRDEENMITGLYGLRNGIRIDEFSGIVNMPSLKAGLKKRAAIGLNGSHCFSYLLNGRGVVNKPTGKYPTGKYETYVNQLFAEHPEWFPLINGKRVPIYHCGGEPQPCTSNPEVIRRFARHIVAIQKASPPGSIYWFMNNDLPKWCECPECVKQDPPEEKAEGIVSTRYWKFLNAVLKEVRKELPDVRIGAVTYQNYSMPPVGIKPDTGVYNLMLSNHRRCWKHRLDDPSCPTNKWYLNYNRVWDRMGIPIYTWEECYVFGESFLPNEKAVVETLRFYRKNMPNILGFRTEVVCPDGIFNHGRGTFLNKNNWYMMWQMMYLSAAFQWKTNQDYDKIYEEINSLYYGKAWAGGMREFRRLLEEAYFSSAGCWG